MIKIRYIALALPFLFLTYCRCSTDSPKEITGFPREVRVRLPQDPENLNPVSYTNIYGLQVISLLFQSLLSTTGTQAQLKPLLAQSLPTIHHSDTAVNVTYRLRPEAYWDNGRPVTAADVHLSMKMIMCPLLKNEKLRMRYESVQDVLTQASDETTVTFICDKNTADPIRLTGAFFIVPEYVYDPKGLLKNITYKELTSHHDSVKQNPDIRRYADWFNTEQATRNTALLHGSGGYILSEWKTGQYVKADKKENWWATKLPEKPDHITANPESINFQIIPDNAIALRALKDNAIDVYSSIPANDFIQLTQNPQFTQNFNSYTPNTYDFTYIGINGRSEKFSDRITRQAFAHLLDIPAIIQITHKNFATRVAGPVKPDDPFYNKDIQLCEYNPQKATQLLKQAGWENKKGQWIKFINEHRIELKVHLQYRAGNTDHENIALILKQAANQINIPVDIQAVDAAMLTENLRTHNFELFIRGLSGSPGEYDYKSILHTESAGVGGNNYTGFGTPESDSLITAINDAHTEQAKAACLKRFQEILYEEANTIFLYTVKNRIAVSNKLTNTKLTASKYGFDVSAFTYSTQ